MYLIPPVTCLILLPALWHFGHLPRPLATAAWVACGVAAQWLAPVYSPLWLAGLVTNAGTGVYLMVRAKLAW